MLSSLRRHELHRWPLHRLGNRLRVAEVVLLSLPVGPHVLGWHQRGIVTKRLKLAAEMMRTNTSLYADQARRQIGEPLLPARDHIWRGTIAPRPSRPTMRNEFLPISMPVTATSLLRL